MTRLYLLSVLLILSIGLFAQGSLDPLTEAEYLSWNSIKNEQLSRNGQWIAYAVAPAWGDAVLHLKHASDDRELIIPRGSKPHFDYNGDYFHCMVTPHMDSIRTLKRRKVKKEDMPGDTLLVIKLEDFSTASYANASNTNAADDWGDWVAFNIDLKKDTSATKRLPRKIAKGESTLLLLQLSTGSIDTVLFSNGVVLAQKEPALAVRHSSSDSVQTSMVSNWMPSTGWQVVYDQKGKTSQLGIGPYGKQIAFLTDTDTSGARIRPYALQYWANGKPTKEIASQDHKQIGPNEMLSPHRKVSFTEDGISLMFGISEKPILQDTSLLEDEIAQVEVWSYTDARLFTQQESQEEDDRERSYLAIYRPAEDQLVRLGNEEVPQVQYHTRRDFPYALGYNLKPYQRFLSWEGLSYRDIYLIDTRSGSYKRIATKVAGWPSLSPSADYLTWYNMPDSSWNAYSIENDKVMQLNLGNEVVFYDELNDRPMHPSPYGSPGWTADAHFLLYDRYDIWKIDPATNGAAVNLTAGRSGEVVHRIIRLDRDDPFVASGNSLLHRFYRDTKEESYGALNLQGPQSREYLKLPNRLDRSPIRAKEGAVTLYTAESYSQYPDLILADNAFAQSRVVSDANPQQKNYSWGTIELVRWTDGEGIEHEGMLAKPDNFDPNGQYPMIVNFYERSADGLHRHRQMNPGRSTISYPFYTSNGYVIFNPDIHYRIGHPGLSALEDVVSGTQHILDMGFVDPGKVGLQGHSWGGYQIADIISRTDMFACAESGAPVVNMVSAYGGIRWGSGMSRMFQYEHTQSRLGGTLWEKPELYLENSPIFRMDKVNTPVLIMHNDKDTAVPWYQGIEFFVAMRRLNKPAWMLNYNGEPHWAVKWQNRLDFNKRMFQFFNHYLKGEPMPKWMVDGVPAIEKGINQGYELIKP
ncbi:MAG: prolyl oligopeptidase family serine peptidase [Saprospiraceae bacterium]|nr:prolyl oligopeptidase family serine peptidase [Saprospiraceae bacterium]